MCSKGADSMAVSGLSFRNTLVGSGWVTVILLCMNRLGKQSSHFARHPFLVGKTFSVWVSVCQLKTVTIATSLMCGCGLGHERVEDDCKSICVKFGG